MEKKEYIIIFITSSSKKEAALIADTLLKKRLAACANIINGVKSIFWWNEKIDKASETLLVIKTTKSNFSKVRKAVIKIHSYDVPEIIGVRIAAGEEKYLKWIDESVKK